MPDSIPPTPLLPGGVGVGRVVVDATPGPDGLAGGTPHVHLASTEAYYVLAGHGSVQTLSTLGLGEVELAPGSLAWLSAGVLHRLVNADGKLEILVIGQNGELSAAEDVVLTFGAEAMADPVTYACAAADPVRQRRDAAVEAFSALRAEYQFKGKPVLDKFYASAVKIVKARAPEWYRRWSTGPSAATAATSVNLNNLRHGHVGHLAQGRVGLADAPPAEQDTVGPDGTRAAYLPEGA